MKRILDYFTIDGAVGGNQEWFKNVVMYIGGCAAATACDCCIYLALRKGMKHLYPFDVEHLTREDYVAFSMKMKPCLRPRVNGVNKLYMFTEGFGKYLSEAGEKDLFMEDCPGPGAARRRSIYQAADRQRLSGPVSYAAAQEGMLQGFCLALVPLLRIRGKRRRLLHHRGNVWGVVHVPAQGSVGHRL